MFSYVYPPSEIIFQKMLLLRDFEILKISVHRREDYMKAKFTTWYVKWTTRHIFVNQTLSLIELS